MNNEDNVNALLFSPKTRRLVTASWGDGKSIRAWLWRPEDFINLACSRLPRNLTFQEWKRYLPDEPYRKTCPDLPIHPSFTRAGRDLARAGDVKGAVGIFRRAKELEPTLDLDPEKRARELAAQSLVAK